MFLSLIFSNCSLYILNFKDEVEFPLFITKHINIGFKAGVYTLILNADLNAEKIHFDSCTSNISFTFNDIYISSPTCHIVAQIWRSCFSYCIEAFVMWQYSGSLNEITFESVLVNPCSHL